MIKTLGLFFIVEIKPRVFKRFRKTKIKRVFYKAYRTEEELTLALTSDAELQETFDALKASKIQIITIKGEDS